MKERTLGDRLRIRRLKLNRSLKDIEKETNIPLHYLLALELNRFDAIPVEDLDHY
ncbi:helix-turn-helix domain-containing protein, partial [Streptococcus suis]